MAFKRRSPQMILCCWYFALFASFFLSLGHFVNLLERFFLYSERIKKPCSQKIQNVSKSRKKLHRERETFQWVKKKQKKFNSIWSNNLWQSFYRLLPGKILFFSSVTSNMESKCFRIIFWQFSFINQYFTSRHYQCKPFLVDFEWG